MKKLIAFLKKYFPEGIQMFNTANIAGDFMITIYYEDNIEVNYAPGYNYIEIFGLSKDEFEQVNNIINHWHLKKEEK